MAADFSCIPCAGVVCFRKPAAERKTCAQATHHCTAHDYKCRCCEECTAHCRALDEALEKINGS